MTSPKQMMIDLVGQIASTDGFTVLEVASGHEVIKDGTDKRAHIPTQCNGKSLRALMAKIAKVGWTPDVLTMQQAQERARRMVATVDTPPTPEEDPELIPAALLDAEPTPVPEPEPEPESGPVAPPAPFVDEGDGVLTLASGALVVYEGGVVTLPSGATVRNEWVTQELAAEYLPLCSEEIDEETGRRSQRKLTAGRKTKLSGALERDEWEETHQGAAFDTHGRCVDGRGRFTAIAETGVAVQMLVTRDLPVRSTKVIDTGKSRGNGDLAFLLGLSSGDLAAATLRALFLWDNVQEQERWLRHPQLSPEQMETTYKDHPTLPDSIRAGGRLRSKSKLLPTAATTGYHLITLANPESPAELKEFFDRLESGRGYLDGNDPTWLLREWARGTRGTKGAKDKATPWTQSYFLHLHLLIKAWNNTCKGPKHWPKAIGYHPAFKVQEPIVLAEL